MTHRAAEHPRPDHFLLHISDTHLLAGGGSLYDRVPSEQHLQRLFDGLAASGARPEAIVFTGDLADRGEPDAYRRLRAVVDPAAAALGARVVWVMGNHDERGAFRAGLLDEPATDEPVDRVVDLDGLRVVVLDTSVPGSHHGEVDEQQLDWLADVLATPAPHGTILAMHHPPVPSVQDLAATVELRDQHRLAPVLAGTDVRAILAGHLHLSSSASFAGIPVSVASATCYTQDLTVPVGGQRAQDGARAYNLVHVYPSAIVHSVVPLEVGPPLDLVTAREAASRLRSAGIRVPEATGRLEPVPG